jgi:acetylornithine deacetylase
LSPSSQSTKDYALRLLKRIVSINSVNPEMDPDSPGELELSNFLKDELSRIGLEARTQRVPLKSRKVRRQNTIGRLRLGGGRKTKSTKTLMLNGHMDTVPSEGMKIPAFKAVVRNGFLYGRGSSDMKGGIASFVAAAKLLAESDEKFSGELLLAFVTGEEYLSSGTESIVQSHKYQADGAIVGEPTDLKLALAHKGFTWFEVEVLGRAAHGSVPEEGVDAIERAAKLVQKIETSLKPTLSKKNHPLVGYPRIHTSWIEGGRAWNIIADRCVLKLERRTIPGESSNEVYDEIKNLIEEIRSEDKASRSAQFKLSRLFERDPLETKANEPIAHAVISSYQKVFRIKATPIGMPYWTDAAYLSKPGGVPSIVIGPGSVSEAHTAGEKVDVAQVYTAVDLYAESVREFFRAAEARS